MVFQSPMLPSSLVCRPPPRNFDVFLSFRGKDTRRSFISFLYKELIEMGLRTFKDDEEIQPGRRFSDEISLAIENSKVAIVVVSKEFTGSRCCLDELVKIMDIKRKGSLTVVPIFYDVEPSDLRWQKHKVAEQFEKHKEREPHEKVDSWNKALVSLAEIFGLCPQNMKDDSKLVEEVAKITSYHVFGQHMKHLSPLSHFACKNGVRIYGICAEEGTSRSTLARDLFKSSYHQFQNHCFLENIEVYSSSSLIKTSLMGQKVLLVVNNVSSYGQLNALEKDIDCFAPGSVVVVATPSLNLLVSYAKKHLYNASYHPMKVELKEIVYKVRLRVAVVSRLTSNSTMSSNSVSSFPICNSWINSFFQLLEFLPHL